MNSLNEKTFYRNGTSCVRERETEEDREKEKESVGYYGPNHQCLRLGSAYIHFGKVGSITTVGSFVSSDTQNCRRSFVPGA